MKNLEKIINSWLFLGIYHLVFLILILVNTIYLDKIAHCKQVNNDLKFSLNDIQQRIDRLQNTASYQNSDEYKEKLLRERNYKLKGETIIDTATVEPFPENPQEKYIPDESVVPRNNIEKWVAFVFPKDQTAQNAKCN